MGVMGIGWVCNVGSVSESESDDGVGVLWVAISSAIVVKKKLNVLDIVSGSEMKMSLWKIEATGYLVCDLWSTVLILDQIIHRFL